MSRHRIVYVEVRCCCQPTKVLGWLPAPRAMVVEGDRLSYITRPRGARLRDGEGGLEVEQLSEERVELPVAMFMGESIRGLALKSEDTPIETLRKIAGFVDATTGAPAPREVL